MLHLPAVISQQMKYDKTPHREQTPRQRRLWMIGRGYQVTGVAVIRSFFSCILDSGGFSLFLGVVLG